MKEYIEKRVLELANYMIETGDTVRGAGEKWGVSKSTVHTDVTKRLKKVDYQLYLKVEKVLEVNLSERHVRGGESTRLKYATLTPSPLARGTVKP